MKLLHILLPLLLFTSCSVDLNKEDTPIDSRPIIGGVDMTDFWLIYEGNLSTTDNNLTATMDLKTDGICWYKSCSGTQAGCGITNTTYRWRVKDNNLTIIDTLETNYLYKYKNKLNELVFLNDSNQTFSFKTLTVTGN